MSAILYPVKSDSIQQIAGWMAGLPETGAVYRAGDLPHARRLAALSRPSLLVVDGTAGDAQVIEFVFDFKTCYPVARILFLVRGEVPPDLAAHGQVDVLPLPLQEAETRKALVALLDPHSLPERTAYRAVLEQVTLLDVLQIKVFSGSTCALSIIGGRGESGTIVLERGSVCHAASRRKTGLAAFYDILFWPGGTIEEIPVADPLPRSIDGDTPSLLMDAAQRLDERRRAPALPPGEQDTSPIRHDVNGRTVHLGDAAEERLDELPALPKFLVVDDNPMILRYADEVLARHWPDHAVITVQTAGEALACAQEFRPRLIVLDLMLPDGTGDGVARKMRDDLDLTHIPIVMISGRVDELRDVVRECPNVVATLAKPFTPNQLIETVRAAEAFLNA